MAKKDQQFKFFIHENLELKKQLLEIARSKRTNEPLASALIYASIAEYLAENLLENLRNLVYRASYEQFAGILFVDERADDSKKTMGHIVRELSKYFFSDKDEVIRLLGRIAECRNNLFHNLAKITPADTHGLDEALRVIPESVEELIYKIDVIYAGFQKILVVAQQQSAAGQGSGTSGDVQSAASTTTSAPSS